LWPASVLQRRVSAAARDDLWMKVTL
jgi:hypothetical protein